MSRWNHNQPLTYTNSKGVEPGLYGPEVDVFSLHTLSCFTILLYLLIQGHESVTSAANEHQNITYKNKLTNSMRYSKMDHYSKLLEENKNNNNDTLTVLNAIIYNEFQFAIYL